MALASPDADDALEGRPERGHLAVLLLGTAILALVLGLGVGGLAYAWWTADLENRAFYGLLLTPAAIGWAAAIPLAALYDVLLARSWRFRLEPDGLVAEYGVYVAVRRIIPRARVQYADLTSTPLQRRLDVVDLALFTPGDARPALIVPCIRPQTAERIRIALDAPAPDGRP